MHPVLPLHRGPGIADFCSCILKPSEISKKSFKLALTIEITEGTVLGGECHIPAHGIPVDSSLSPSLRAQPPATPAEPQLFKPVFGETRSG